tara:strand:+ start:1731 stop:2636 length:906 start_codon:yes stop_codon:yes gene_type:complete
MKRLPSPLVRVDELVRDTANYAVWLPGTAATASRIGVHGFEFDAHDQSRGVALDAFHVLLCLDGQAAIRRDLAGAAEEMTLRAGDVLVNPMGVPLRWRWSGAVKVLNVTVHPGHLGDLARESLGAAVRLRPLRLGHRSDSVLGAFGADLHRELSAPRVLGADRAARAIGERIALHLLRHYLEVERNERDRTFDEDERRALESHVAAHLDEPLGVGDLAAVAGLGEHHFSRTFRATYGRPPATWLRERRLEHAHGLLVRTSETIAEIAIATGFSDQSHLTRWFRRHYGVTPAALRRQRTRSS